ncbi:MAG: 50S ribosomal protein L28, partial [SAR202 cluster bacterium]|nr:50S ribosomal protein L28 [SAR202 cluster bacterium]
MAKCDICHRAGQSGNNVSHSKRHTRTRWFTNVQRTTIYVDGAPRKVKICTR